MKNKTNFLKYLRIVLTLCLITAVMGALLAGVNLLAEPYIQAAAERAMNEAIAVVFGECEATLLEEACTEPVTAVYRVTVNGEQAGFCVFVEPNGYGGAVEMMVGLTTAGEVCGVSIVDHGETNGIGTKVLDDAAYLAQYNGLSEPITFGAGIDAIAGATRTSNAVRDGVNAALRLGLGQTPSTEERSEAA